MGVEKGHCEPRGRPVKGKTVPCLEQDGTDAEDEIGSFQKWDQQNLGVNWKLR